MLLVAAGRLARVRATGACPSMLGGWILIGGGSVPLSAVRSTAVCIIRAQQTQHNKYIIVYKIVLNDKMTKGESLIISPELLKGTVSDIHTMLYFCLLYTSPSPRDRQKSRMPSSA